ncbi:MAG: basic amino acid ABC transporter substrate-binding protein [Arenicellales bacterium]
MRHSILNTSAVAAAAIAVAFGLGLATSQPAQAAGKTYTVCSDIPWPPFEMGTDGQKAFGFDIDLMRAIAAVEGYEVKIQNLSFDSIIPALRAGKCDIGASGFTITDKRKEVVDFSDPYYLSNQAVVTRSDGKVNIVTALAGHGPTGTVGAQRGTTGADWVKNNLEKMGIKVKLKLYETYPLAILDLVNGRIDAVVQDEPASKASVSSYPKKLTVAGILKTYEYFGFDAAKDNPDGLIGKINDGIKKLGLMDVPNPAGMELNIQPGTPWADLSAAYFGPDNKAITAAWDKCKDGILSAKGMDDVKSYAQCMAGAVK